MLFAQVDISASVINFVLPSKTVSVEDVLADIEAVKSE
jgi:hypothetical protein